MVEFDTTGLNFSLDFFVVFPSEDGGKSSCIMYGAKKMRNRPQCRVTTPLWAPGADFGQRTKKTKSGAKFGPKMTLVRDPGVAGDDLNK